MEITYKVGLNNDNVVIKKILDYQQMFMKSNDFQLPHDGISKKHSLKQVLLIIYTLEETIFAAATFKGLWVFSLQSKKTCGMF